MSSYRPILFVAGFLALILGVGIFRAEGQVAVSGTTLGSREALEQQIRDRAQELQKINDAIAATQKSLADTKNERVTLQKELQTLQYTANQLELTIKSDEVSLKKLGLEIRSITLDIEDIRSSVQDKKEAIIEIFHELQKNSQANLLVMLLKNKSLADGVLEAQTLSNLNTQLTADVQNLKVLHAELAGKATVLESKKKQTDLHQQNLLNRKVIVQDQKQERQTLIAETKNKETLFQKQISDLEQQQNAVSDEIGKIEDELRLRFDASILPTKRSGALLWPVQLVKNGGKGVITQHFGEISSLYRGKPHNGLDIGVPIGTPVFAAEDGSVVAVDNNDRSRSAKYQYGKYILIRHPNNLATLYAHLSRQTITAGSEVKRGDLIGYSGNTGYATGPHLHLGLYWAPSIFMKAVPPAAGLVPVGVTVAPEDYL